MQWKKNMRLIDANVILRCILDDNPEMTAEAIAIIDSGAYTKPEIIAEVVYVLQKVYGVQRPQIRDMLLEISEVIYCTDEKSVMYALEVYAAVSLDFVDCLLIAYNKINRENVFSFDKKLNKYLQRLDV